MESFDTRENEYKFKYIVWTTSIVLIYVLMVTFLPIPEKNQRFVDISLSFLLGFMSNNGGMLTGFSKLGSKDGTKTGEAKGTNKGTISDDSSITD